VYYATSDGINNFVDKRVSFDEFIDKVFDYFDGKNMIDTITNCESVMINGFYVYDMSNYILSSDLGGIKA
jgi:hypothetical protein